MFPTDDDIAECLNQANFNANDWGRHVLHLYTWMDVRRTLKEAGSVANWIGIRKNMADLYDDILADEASLTLTDL